MRLDLSLFSPKVQPLVGLDISSSAVKMVELSAVGKGDFCVERYAIEPLPKDVVADGNIVNLEVVADTVKKTWRRLNTTARNVAMALPAAAVITKKIIVPAGQREEELEVLVESEANQYIPFPLEEVNLDFQVIGEAPSSPDEVEVLIAASRKEKVEDRVAVAESAGLKPVIMDVESYAMLAAFPFVERQLPSSGSDKIVALVDVGQQLVHTADVREVVPASAIRGGHRAVANGRIALPRELVVAEVGRAVPIEQEAVPAPTGVVLVLPLVVTAHQELLGIILILPCGGRRECILWIGFQEVGT